MSERLRVDEQVRVLLGAILDGSVPVGATAPHRIGEVEVGGEALQLLASLGVTAAADAAAAIRSPTEWRIRVMSYVPETASNLIPPSSVRARDGLDVVRLFYLVVVRTAARRVGPTGLDAAREALERAWQLRGDPRRFYEANHEVLKSVLVAAQMIPLLWILNEVQAVSELQSEEQDPLPPPPDYREAHHAVFDAIERGDAEGATATISDYLDRLESRLVSHVRQGG